MQRNFLLKASLALLIIAGSFIFIWSSAGGNTTKTTCSESMEGCCNKNNKSSNSGEMILETISRQFFSNTEISN